MAALDFRLSIYNILKWSDNFMAVCNISTRKRYRVYVGFEIFLEENFLRKFISVHSRTFADKKTDNEL